MDAIFGFFDTLMTPIYAAISGVLVAFHTLWSPVLGSEGGWTWVLSIMCLTVVIRTLLIPLFVKQIRSSRNMMHVQPKLKALQEKYGHDRERLGQETMKLYREEGVNPMASCFPLLLQMPILIGLYRVLSEAAFGRPLGYFLENNLSLVDSLANAEIFGARISDRFWPIESWGPVQTVALVLILAMTALLFFTQREMMQKNMSAEAMTGPMGQTQKMMLYGMPVMFAFFGVSIPIGVLVYWTTSNAWTMGQQFLLMRNNPTPGSPAYADWEDRMRAKGKDPEYESAKRSGRKVEKPAPKHAGTATKVKRGAAEPEAVEGPAEAPRVQRQQPRRQTRSNRRR
ncbi:membrane protein insertase YidC [Parenemella sanctibonifatiensis]|uniref:Membrane protein insertase YidC n=1 Tax=Parenemella sanctibonifatiensis TaxID=2016505 RepID=A0A255EHJ8_9ACTN|nr:membrane protein insertase YidC [Parenemella sanctibonifatiensis]OYN90720.1 membrane protein insertase YidC [Parenemella sanctibonifatiensis]